MRVLRGTVVALLLALLVACVASLALGARAGYHVYVVRSASMTPTYSPGDVVVTASVPTVTPGQVITFLHSSRSDDVVSHRVTDVSAAGIIHTRGDANPAADAWDIRAGQVEGTVFASAPRLGYAIVYLKQPLGLASLVTVVVMLALLWQLFFPAPLAITGRHELVVGRAQRTGGLDIPAAGSVAITDLDLRDHDIDLRDHDIDLRAQSGEHRVLRIGGKRSPAQ
jgi:signal peptidase I